MKINYFCLLHFVNFFQQISTVNITNGTKVLLSSSNKLEIAEGCREVIIPNNFKKLNISLTSNDIDEIVITDSQIKICEWETIGKCCNKNSTFCIENKKPKQSYLNVNHCLDHSFLYVCKYPKNKTEEEIIANGTIGTNNTTNETTNSTNDEWVISTNETEFTNGTAENDNPTEEPIDNSMRRLTQQISTIQIVTNVIKGLGCQSVEFLNETACSTLGMTNCHSPDHCSNSCAYVECRANTEKVFSMCLPTNMTESKIKEKCSNHISFNDVTPTIYKESCTRSATTTHDTAKSSSHTLFKFIALIFGVLLLAVFIASVYYRLKLGIDNEPPFEPPYFVPNFIFPRQNNY